MIARTEADMLKIMKEDFELVGASDIYESCIYPLINLGYFNLPASIHHHGQHIGDLFRHSMQVAHILKNFTDKLNIEWDNPRSPIIVGYFHDLCKCDDYIYDHETNMWEYREDKLLEGHGDKSVMIASTLCKLTTEEMLCIRYHMGAYNKDDWKGFDIAISRFSTVLLTHTADMVASKIVGI